MKKILAVCLVMLICMTAVFAAEPEPTTTMLVVEFPQLPDEKSFPLLEQAIENKSSAYAYYAEPVFFEEAVLGEQRVYDVKFINNVIYFQWQIWICRWNDGIEKLTMARTAEELDAELEALRQFVGKPVTAFNTDTRHVYQEASGLMIQNPKTGRKWCVVENLHTLDTIQCLKYTQVVQPEYTMIDKDGLLTIFVCGRAKEVAPLEPDANWQYDSTLWRDLAIAANGYEAMSRLEPANAAAYAAKAVRLRNFALGQDSWDIDSTGAMHVCENKLLESVHIPYGLQCRLIYSDSNFAIAENDGFIQLYSWGEAI